MSEQYHQRPDDDPLAYGDYNQPRSSGNQGSGRSLVGDTLKKFKTRIDQYGQRPSDPYGYGSSSQNQSHSQYLNTSQQPQQPQQQAWGQPPPNQQNYSNQQYLGGPSSSTPAHQQYQGQSQPPSANQYQSQSQSQSHYQSTYPVASGKPDLAQKLMGGLQGTIHSIGSDVAGLLGTQYPYNPTQQSAASTSIPGQPSDGKNRFDSFAAPKEGNQVKWYVDGCSYMWAVSHALESARETIWILDWWLSPELYLRRPPQANEEWRLDRVLQRAAQRGVKINIIVYKEVTQALTLCSSHTKHTLEALSPSISVFRHPDHLPDAQTAQSSLVSSLEGLKLDAAGASRLGRDALKGLYGISDDVILYWAHHEKLLLVDGKTAFMGGLDLCFGRWDTHQHPLADAHPSDLNKIVFPGQDYNNARIADFNDVANPFQNKLNRLISSRMGWSDISINLQGPCVDDLRHHFVDRWNFIYDEKYNVRKDVRYSRLTPWGTHSAAEGFRPPQISSTTTQQQQQQQQQQQATGPSQSYIPPPWQASPRPTTPSGPGVQVTQPPSDNRPVSQHYDIAHGQFPPPPPGAPPQMFTTTYQAPSPGQPSHAPSATSHEQAHHSPSPLSQQTHSSQATIPGQEGYQYQAPAPQQPSVPAAYEHSQYSQTPPPQQTFLSQNTAPGQGGQPQQPYGSQYQPGLQTSLPSYANNQPASNSQSSSLYDQQGAATPQYQALHSIPPIPPAQSSHTAELPSQQLSSYQAYHGEASRELGGIQDINQAEYSTDRALGGSRMDRYKQDGKLLGSELGALGNMVYGKVGNKLPSSFRPTSSPDNRHSSRGGGGGMRCQLIRSCTKWSNGTPTEHSIQNAYIDLIRTSEHFVYIENQFFITATGDKQGPVKNQVGAAIVERIVRAARERTPWKMIVLIPAIPGFAGDLIEESSLGTRAICEFQYNSICRGGHSIMEEVQKQNINPMDYIRFYNLRNYDRINASDTLGQAQQQSGIGYEQARIDREDHLGSGFGGQGQGLQYSHQQNPAQEYQQAAQAILPSNADSWDSVSSCYMLGGQDIRSVPWSGHPQAELDAFVSEQLYIHSKVMIVDDRYVICGSANLNDRSMLGSHDSEIALLISDSTPCQSMMAGRPWHANRFAASLRRQLTRKHLGLIRAQDMQRPDDNFMPAAVAPNAYDWNSAEDNVVTDPLSDIFQSLWNTRARTNTEVYRKAFRAVPDDYIRTWTEYKEFYEYYFHQSDPKDPYQTSSRVPYGHAVRDDFPEGVKGLKELLSKVKGTVVEMPLCFLQNEDIAKQGLTLNALTEEVYT